MVPTKSIVLKVIKLYFPKTCTVWLIFKDTTTTPFSETSTVTDGSSTETSFQCRHDEFQCKLSHECIDSSLHCDGQKDCQDNSDELDCPGIFYNYFINLRHILNLYVEIETTTIAGEFSTTETTEKLPECEPILEFTCKDKTCINVAQVCDRKIDCPDGSDESDCYCTLIVYIIHKKMTKTHFPDETTTFGGKITQLPCSEDQFKCQNEECVNLAQKCDGKQDCTDNSDEVNCIESNVMFQIAFIIYLLIGGIGKRRFSCFYI